MAPLPKGSFDLLFIEKQNKAQILLYEKQLSILLKQVVPTAV